MQLPKMKAHARNLVRAGAEHVSRLIATPEAADLAPAVVAALQSFEAKTSEQAEASTELRLARLARTEAERELDRAVVAVLLVARAERGNRKRDPEIAALAPHGSRALTGARLDEKAHLARELVRLLLEREGSGWGFAAGPRARVESGLERFLAATARVEAALSRLSEARVAAKRARRLWFAQMRVSHGLLLLRFAEEPGRVDEFFARKAERRAEDGAPPTEKALGASPAPHEDEGGVSLSPAA